MLKRQLLAAKVGGDELAAIDAAFDRLMAWARSGAPVPGEAAPDPGPTAILQPERVGEGEGGPDLATGEEAAAAAQLAAAWADELARQQDRHARRRSRYEAVRPQPVA